MTPFVLRHYDAFRSPLLVTCFPQIVILNGGKHALWEKRETGQWHRVKNLLPGWRLTAFLTTAADPSHPLRMTFNISLIMTLNASLIMTPFLQSSFWTGASMPCGKDEKRDGDTEWRIYYPDDVLPASSLRQQILHIRFGWRLMFPSLWRLTSYTRIMESAVGRSCWRT